MSESQHLTSFMKTVGVSSCHNGDSTGCSNGMPLPAVLTHSHIVLALKGSCHAWLITGKSRHPQVLQSWQIRALSTVPNNISWF